MAKAMALRANDLISIGTLAERTGMSVSAIRYYETQGLITATRNAGGHRRFLRSDMRRLSFILIAQKLGFSIRQIGEQLDRLPQRRTPTKADWTRISHAMRKDLDARIALLSAMRDRLDGCIGCGCLSLRACALYNPQDEAASQGVGPRKLLNAETGASDKAETGASDNSERPDEEDRRDGDNDHEDFKR